jgi:hypothetical protein
MSLSIVYGIYTQLLADPREEPEFSGSQQSPGHSPKDNHPSGRLIVEQQWLKRCCQPTISQEPSCFPKPDYQAVSVAAVFQALPDPLDMNTFWGHNMGVVRSAPQTRLLDQDPDG